MPNFPAGVRRGIGKLDIHIFGVGKTCAALAAGFVHVARGKFWKANPKRCALGRLAPPRFHQSNALGNCFGVSVHLALAHHQLRPAGLIHAPLRVAALLVQGSVGFFAHILQIAQARITQRGHFPCLGVASDALAAFGRVGANLDKRRCLAVEEIKGACLGVVRTAGLDIAIESHASAARPAFGKNLANGGNADKNTVDVSRDCADALALVFRRRDGQQAIVATVADKQARLAHKLIAHLFACCLNKLRDELTQFIQRDLG